MRKFNAWKDAYRNDINSWGLYVLRARFDVGYAKIAVDNATGERLIRAPPGQIRLVCAYCAGGLGHHDASEEVAANGGGHGKEGEETVVHHTEKSVLTPGNAVAAASGRCVRNADAICRGVGCVICGWERKMIAT